MGSRGSSSGKLTPRKVENQIKKYMDGHDGKLPSTIFTPTTEQKNLVFEAIDKLYTPTTTEKKIMEFQTIEDGELKTPYGGFGRSVEGLSDKAVNGLKKYIAYGLSKNVYDPKTNRGGAIPPVDEWKKRRR